MPYHHTLNDEDRTNIINWAHEGLGYTAIANKLNNKISKQRVHQLCKQYGIDATKIKQEKTLSTFKTRTPKTPLYKKMKSKFWYKKSNSLRSGVEFTITFEEIDFPTHCPILNIELNYFHAGKYPADNSPSFDRIDSSKGYVPGNVAIISAKANRIKNNGTSEEHRLIANWMDAN